MAQGLVPEQEAGFGPVPSVVHISLRKPGLNSGSQNNHHHQVSSQDAERFSLEEEGTRQKQQQQQQQKTMTALKHFKKNELANGRDFRNEAEPRSEIIKAGLNQGHRSPDPPTIDW